MPRTLTLATALLALTACDRDSMYQGSTFSENVYQAYAECSASEIRFLSSKHNIQTAFEPCGSNHFSHFSWSPDGLQLYFQLPLTAHVMNGENKSIGTLPTVLPTANIAWLAPELMVLPVSPPEGDESPARVILFDRLQASMNTLTLEQSAPRFLQATGERDKVYFVADVGERPGLFLADFTLQTITPAFPWYTGPVESFTYEPVQDLVAIGAGGEVKIYLGATGEQRFLFPDAQRAILHPEGRYIAIETLGAPISPFDQRSWNELSPEAREREERRMEEWLKTQPEWVIREVNPPVIDIYDGELNQRYRFTSFFGDRFQWYPTNFYASFMLWGLEGKEVNRNVALTQLHERLRMAAKGTIPMGLELTESLPTRYNSTPPEIGG